MLISFEGQLLISAESISSETLKIDIHKSLKPPTFYVPVCFRGGTLSASDKGLLGLWICFWWHSLFFSYLAYQAKENGLDYQQGKNACRFTTIFLVTQTCWNNQPHPITLKLHIYIVIKTDCRERMSKVNASHLHIILFICRSGWSP